MFQLFATSGFVNEVVATVLPIQFVTLRFTTPRNVSELNMLHCKERTAISNIFCLFDGEDEVLTVCSDVWSSSP